MRSIPDAYYRHAEYYVDLLTKADVLLELRNENAPLILENIRRDWGQIRQSQDWAADNANADRGATWLLLGYTTARHINQQFLTVPERIQLLEKTETALRTHQSTLVVVTAFPQLLAELAYAYIEVNNYESAINYFQQALSNLSELGASIGEINIQNGIGICYRKLKAYDKALDQLRIVLTRTREIEYRQGEGEALNNIGNVYIDIQNHQNAIDFYEQSLRIMRGVRNMYGESRVFCNLGNTLFKLKQYKKAIVQFKKSLNLSRKLRNEGVEGIALCNLGSSYAAIGNNLIAHNYYQEAAKVFRNASLRLLEEQAKSIASKLDHEQKSLLQRGTLNQGKKYQATEALTIGPLDIYTADIGLPDLGQFYKKVDEVINAENTVTIMMHNQDETDADIKPHGASGSALHFQGIQLARSQSRYLIILANTYMENGDVLEAVKLYQQALETSRNYADARSEDLALSGLGLAFIQLGDMDKANRYLQAAAELNKKHRNL